MAIGWMLQNEGQEKPETSSSGYKPLMPPPNVTVYRRKLH